ncbi:MAG TPA: ribonuclease Z [Anaerolineales bacterium]|nr:ribonuclease Z [Anaerolineales bacterium]
MSLRTLWQILSARDLALFEILFLGTSASAPSAKRGLSAQIVKHDEYRFLIDCGEGTQRQILQSGTGFKNLTRILLTHGHLDHILGLGGLMSTFLRWEAVDELDIFGGRSTLDRVHDLLYGVVLRGNPPPMPLRMNELKPGTFFESDDFTVTAFPVTHRGPDCLGYSFEVKARRPFLPAKADELGVPFGPERRDLVAGNEITLPDGKRVKPDDVLGPVQKGVKLVVVGDAGKTEDLLEVCKDADALVIESTYLDEEAEMARQFSHLTARQGAELAVKAGVKKLILTHISRRYREKDVLKESQAVFPNTAVARDFDSFQIKREE